MDLRRPNEIIGLYHRQVVKAWFFGLLTEEWAEGMNLLAEVEELLDKGLLLREEEDGRLRPSEEALSLYRAAQDAQAFYQAEEAW